MRRLLIFLLSTLFLFVTFVGAQCLDDSSKTAANLSRDAWLAKDKADHFIVSAFLVGCTYYASRQEAHFPEQKSRQWAVGFTLSLGVFKELYDGLSGKGTASVKDFGADVMGACCGYLLCTVGTK